MRWIIIGAIIVFIQLYTYQAVRTVTKKKPLLIGYWVITLGIFGSFFYAANLAFENGFNHLMAYSLGTFLALISFQILTAFLLFFEDVARFTKGVFTFFSSSKESKKPFSPKRRKLLSQIGLGLAALPFSSLLFGMIYGKYNYRVLKYNLTYDDLPDAFDGFTITQISDIHAGSFDNPEKVQYGIDLINEQASDVILFTGDMVNDKAEEILSWVNAFSGLKAKYGKFSVLGNHDYGDYADWENEEEKRANLNTLFKAQKEMGFELLLNESRYIQKDGQKIALVGVENWGQGFKQKGDLNKAFSTVNKKDFKIVMSHDPTHWEAEIVPHPFPVQLTLSGHTHGMQFGIEIPGWIQWSPAKWRYKQWAGIYTSDNQHINVNRGFGYLAYPGRVGIWPEVTVITLKKGTTTV